MNLTRAHSHFSHRPSHCHPATNTRTYSWQPDWRSCERGCPRCWQPSSCRSPRRPGWRPAGSASALELGRWGEGGRDNATTSPSAGGNPTSPHRSGARPARGPPPPCRWLTAGSSGELRGRRKGSQVQISFSVDTLNTTVLFCLQRWSTDVESYRCDVHCLQLWHADLIQGSQLHCWMVTGFCMQMMTLFRSAIVTVC